MNFKNWQNHDHLKKTELVRRGMRGLLGKRNALHLDLSGDYMNVNNSSFFFIFFTYGKIHVT